MAHFQKGEQKCTDKPGTGVRKSENAEHLMPTEHQNFKNVSIQGPTELNGWP